MKKVRLLVIDDIVPRAMYGYGYPRALALYNTFSELGFSLTLLPVSLPAQYVSNDNSELDKTIRVVYLEQKNYIFDFLAENMHSYDGIFISRPKNLRLVIDRLLELENRPKVVYDVEALGALREISRLQLGGVVDNTQFENLISEEVALIQKADLFTCVSHHEMKFLKKRIKKDFFFLSHFHGNKITANSFKERTGLLFVGGFYSVECPNLDALRFFVRDILPIIRTKLDVSFRIVGYNAQAVRDKVPEINGHDVSIISNPSCLYDYYNHARLTVIPTRIGAGISYKFTETLSHGTPSVTTKLIARQVKSRTCRGYDDPARFANRVIELYQNERSWKNERDMSLVTIANNYTREKLHEEILRLRHCLINKNRLRKV